MDIADNLAIFASNPPIFNVSNMAGGGDGGRGGAGGGGGGERATGRGTPTIRIRRKAARLSKPSRQPRSEIWGARADAG